MAALPTQPPTSNPTASLPPEILSMIASLQQGQQPDLMANIQNVLASVTVSLVNKILIKIYDEIFLCVNARVQ